MINRGVVIIYSSSSSGEVGGNHASLGETGRAGFSQLPAVVGAVDGLDPGRVPHRFEMERDREVSPGLCWAQEKKRF